jgi:hypothetical protein
VLVKGETQAWNNPSPAVDEVEGADACKEPEATRTPASAQS